MATATISAFESTLQKTNVWLKDLMVEMHWEHSHHQRAYHALRAVLHALRDRLPIEESSDLASQLPMLIRGFYYEGWNPSKTNVTEHKREEFFQHVIDQFPSDTTIDAEELTRAVFRVLNSNLVFVESETVACASDKLSPQ